MKRNAKKFNKKIGYEISIYRGAKNMTQIDLSKATGISQGAISKIEKGLLSIRFYDAIAIAKALDMDLSSDEEWFGQ